MPRIKNRVEKGDSFGLLTVLESGEKSRTKVLTRCICGQEKAIEIASLIYGSTVSCGKCRAKKHGMHHTKIHNAWVNMMARCYKPDNPAYYNYGGRGIYVCDRWRDFENFYADLGDAPEDRELDRIDNNGPYSPENVRWVTRTRNMRNVRHNIMVTIDGLTKSFADWVDDPICSVTYNTAYARYARGWEASSALTEPLRK